MKKLFVILAAACATGMVQAQTVEDPQMRQPTLGKEADITKTQNQLSMAVENKDITFTANSMTPGLGDMIDLSTMNNHLTITPSKVTAEIPFIRLVLDGNTADNKRKVEAIDQSPGASMIPLRFDATTFQYLPEMRTDKWVVRLELQDMQSEPALSTTNNKTYTVQLEFNNVTGSGTMTVDDKTGEPMIYYGTVTANRPVLSEAY